MAVQTLTVRLPDRLYAQLRDRAQQANRTMEAELVDLVATAMPEQGELSDELGLELAGLEHLDDEALWQAARSRLAATMARRTEKLHHKRQREGLTEAEGQGLAELMRQYERAMLIRAQAAVLLKRRGHDVSKLAGPA
jgi:plasmid stability protein